MRFFDVDCKRKRRCFCRLYQFQIVRLDFYRSRLADEIEAQNHLDRAGSALDKTFHAPERAGFNLHPAPGLDLGGQLDLQIGFKGSQDIVQLMLEKLLVQNVEHIGHVVALKGFLALVFLQVQKQVTGEKRLLKSDRLALVFVHGFKAWKDGLKAFPLAVLLEFLFTPGPRMRHIPIQRYDFTTLFHLSLVYPSFSNRPCPLMGPFELNPGLKASRNPYFQVLLFPSRCLTAPAGQGIKNPFNL
jgi:hypothetical protein